MSPFRAPRPTRSTTLVAVSLLATVVLGAGAWSTMEHDAFAQDEAAQIDADKPARARRKVTKPAEKPQPAATPAPPAAPVAQPAPTPAPAAEPTPQPAPASASQPSTPPVPEVAGQLRQAGAGACAAQVDALAAAATAGAVQFNTVSNWATAGGNDRAVSVSIGQKYPNGSPVPYGATSVMAAPNRQGSCDAMAVEVVPSSLSCAKLREMIAAHSKQIGNLAGVPLMQEADGQTMLVPTAADTCVIIGLHAAYAK